MRLAKINASDVMKKIMPHQLTLRPPASPCSSRTIARATLILQILPIFSTTFEAPTDDGDGHQYHAYTQDDRMHNKSYEQDRQGKSQGKGPDTLLRTDSLLLSFFRF